MTGAEVKTWREARGLSQTQLAKRLPMPLATLQGWERAVARGAPPPFMARALADLERELIGGTRGPKADLVITNDVRHAAPLANRTLATCGEPPRATIRRGRRR